MKHRYLLAGAAIVGCAGCLIMTSPKTVQAAEITDNTRIASGVIVLGQDMGGKTVGEARTMLDDHMQAIAESDLTINFDNQTAVIRVGELGLSWNTEDTVVQAASYAKSGPLITRFKEIVDLRYENAEVPFTYTYDAAKVRAFVQGEIASKDATAENASLRRESGEFIVTPGHSGMVTDVEATVTTITNMMDNDLSAAMTAEAVVELTSPEVSTEMLEAVHDRLATFSTDYSSSSSNRKTNIRVAAGHLNGSLLMPGESLSVSKTIRSRSPENGYMLAPQYVNGTTEQSYGGGVCQVSTTLYNAVIRAELKVNTRHPHSMVVHYVPYSADAAIAEGNKDFVFTNDQEYPVYIAASADGSTLTFSIYGKETRPSGRKIEFVSRTLSEDYPDPVIQYDDSQYEDYEELTGSSSPAIKSTLTKVVYMNGSEVSRTLLHTDHYSGQRRTLIKGTKVRPTEPETTQPAPTQPAPTQPTQPAPTQPETTKPAPTQPAPTEPAPTQPPMVDPPEPDETEESQPA